MISNFAAILRCAGLVLAISVVLLSSANAYDGQIATPQQRAACTPDAFRLCSSHMPNIGAITTCMRTNFEKLSPACKAVFPK